MMKTDIAHESKSYLIAPVWHGPSVPRAPSVSSPHQPVLADGRHRPDKPGGGRMDVPGADVLIGSADDAASEDIVKTDWSHRIEVLVGGLNRA
jgi:hypothetical protein